LFFWLYIYTISLQDARDQLFTVLSETEWSLHVYDDVTVPDFQLQAHRIFDHYVAFHQKVNPYLGFIKGIEEQYVISDFTVNTHPEVIVLTLDVREVYR
jgi:hypothetical protein